MPQVKVIHYDNLSKEQREDPKILPFIYKKPFEEELKDLEKERSSSSGIMSTEEAKMRTRDLKKFYGGYLVPYGYKENDLMQMPLRELEYLFNQVMSI